MQRHEFVPQSYPHELLKKDWGKRKCFYTNKRFELLRQVHNMTVLENDVWLVTLPKCGTTWMQELLWLLMHNCDFEAAKAEELEIRSPFLEFDFILNENIETALQPVEQLSQPRLIKTHLHLPLLPAQLWSVKPKTVYVYRNPKDSIVSEFYHARSLGFDTDKDLNAYVMEYLQKSACTHMPFEHATEFYMLRHEPWLFYTSFERMKLNLRHVINELCVFLNKTVNEEQMQQLLKHLSFEEMKDNPRTNHRWEFGQVRRKHNLPYEDHNFIRKGKVGGYKDELNAETIVQLDKWIEEEILHHQQELPGLTLDDLLLLDDKK